MSAEFTFRPYRASDEGAAIALWHRTWQSAYPDIDFDARLDSWRARWRVELVPLAQIIVAERDNALAGFVTIDDKGYLDQLVVDSQLWGSGLGDALVNQAKLHAPSGITLLVNTDNIRAIRFYERNGFVLTHDDVNPTSGRAVCGMAWTP